MKKFLSLLLSLAISLSLCVPAFAAGTDSASDVSLSSDVAAPDIFNVIVPAEIPIHMNSDGNTQVAQTLEIQNKSSKAVEVINIQVDGKDDWRICDFNADLAAEPANTHDLALSFRGDVTDSTGNIALSQNNWRIGLDSNLALNTIAKLPLQTYSGKSSIATVIWTIDWAGELPENPDENDITVRVLPGDNGHADVDEITAGSDGKISVFPDVTPDDGYVFDHWVDQDGNPVDENTVFESGDVIKPVFKQDDRDSFVIRVLPGDHGKADVDEIMPESDGRVVSYPDVQADTGYDFKNWVNAESMNLVDETTVYEAAASIRPVFALKSGWTRVPVTPVPGIDITPKDDPEILIDPDGTVQVVPDIKPEDGYEYNGMTDQDGNPVTPGANINININITIIINVTKTDGGSGEDPAPDKTVTVPVLPGDHGSSDADSITTDSNGKIPTFPDVTPDEGYLPDGWVDQDGNPVDENTVFGPDDSIKPVFKPDPDYKPDKTVTVPVLPGDNGNADVDSVTTDADGKIPVFPDVTPDEGYLPDGWVDQDGNPVDENTVFEQGDSIKPVFKPDPDYKPDKTVTVPVLSGDHGSSDADSVTTDSDGKISTFPGVTPDEGYLPDGWVDQDGNPVDENTVFEQGDSIKPVFKADSDYKSDVTVSFMASRYNGTISNSDSVTVPAGTKWSEIEKPTTHVGTSATFMGWYNDATELTDDYEINSDMAACAEFQSWFTTNGSIVTGLNKSAYLKAGHPNTVTIPNIINGVTMTAIGDYAFTCGWPADDTTKNPQLYIKYLTIADGYETFGVSSMAGFINAASVKLPNTLKRIEDHGMHTFGRDTNIGTLTLPSSLQYIGAYGFAESGFSKIIVQNGCVCDGHMSFSYMNNLEYLTIGEGTTDITSAFQSSGKLRVLVLPSTITTMGANGVSFTGCTGLRSVTCYADPNNIDSLKSVENLRKISSSCVWTWG